MIWVIPISTLIYCGGLHFLLGSSVALVVSLLILTIFYQRLHKARYRGLFYTSLLLLSFSLGALSHLVADFLQPWF